MVERKCSVCREPGHTKAACRKIVPTVHVQPCEDGCCETTVEYPAHGPGFEAQFPGMCDECLAPFEAGDRVRADGQGGYECEAHAEPVSDPAPTVEPMADNAIDQFLSPAAVVEEKTETISGQPEPERDRWGRYLLIDPRTGKKKGFTRATTFNKTLSDTFALSQWGKRNVAIGLAARPDLLALAHGKDVRADKKELDGVVEQAETAAGNKVGANLGTALHTTTERIDAGLMRVADVPPFHRPEVQAYVDATREAGLAFRRDWIERTTMTSKFGEDVAGTFDRIGTLPDCSAVIVDLKTGRDPLTYGAGEIAIQLLTYALGVNEFGIYDHVTGEWEEGPLIRTDLALVIHLPAQRDDGRPAECSLHWVNLADPDVMEAARQSAFARRWRKKKGLHTAYTRDVASSWEQRFSTVTSSAQAGSLWLEAKAAGVEPMELQRLVRLAQDELKWRCLVLTPSTEIA